MESNYPLFLSLALLSVLAGMIVLFLLFRQRRLARERENLNQELDSLRCQLSDLHKKIHSPEEAPEPAPPRPFVMPDPPLKTPQVCPAPLFELPICADLEGELSSRLQGAAGGGGEAPERYKHVASLVERGLGADEISRILHISQPEAEQLIALSRVAR